MPNPECPFCLARRTAEGVPGYLAEQLLDMSYWRRFTLALALLVPLPRRKG